MARTDDRSLEGIHLLAALPPEVCRHIEGLCQWRRFARGEEIVSHEDASRDVFLIARGRVRVHLYTASGHEITFEDLTAGGHFGEVAALDGRTRSASVVALEPTTLACLSGPMFLDLCRQHPELALSAMRQMVAIMRQFNDRVVALSTLGAPNRVHAELLRLARGDDAEGNPQIIRSLPRHAEIAARVSTTRETVARVLAELVRRGLVERQGDGLLIRDPERLAAMVDEVRHG